MIGFLRGNIIAKAQDHIILDVGGVGYKIFLTEYHIDACADNEQRAFHIYTHVREQEIALYGFVDAAEQDIFELLISVSGIGPKAALNILSITDVASITTAIANEDITILTKVSGIGPKIAKKIVTELSGKVVAVQDASCESVNANVDAIDALKSLGYSVAEARDALESVPDDITDVGERVKEALKNVGKK